MGCPFLSLKTTLPGLLGRFVHLTEMPPGGKERRYLIVSVNGDSRHIRS